MTGTLLSAAIQGAGSIWGAVESSKANKRAMDLINKDEKAWQDYYDKEMKQDYMERPEIKKAVQTARDLAGETLKKARAMNIVAGGTDEALVLQQEEANNLVSDVMSNAATQAALRKDALEADNLTRQSGYTQQKVAIEQARAENIASAAGQLGKIVGGLAGAGMDGEIQKANV